MTKSAFLETYRKELLARYPWAQDATKLRRFMQACADTICFQHKSWNHDGEAVAAAWRAIGGKGKPTLKGLRSLA